MLICWLTVYGCSLWQQSVEYLWYRPYSTESIYSLAPDRLDDHWSWWIFFLLPSKTKGGPSLPLFKGAPPPWACSLCQHLTRIYHLVPGPLLCSLHSQIVDTPQLTSFLPFCLITLHLTVLSSPSSSSTSVQTLSSLPSEQVITSITGTSNNIHVLKFPEVIFNLQPWLQHTVSHVQMLICHW